MISRNFCVWVFFTVEKTLINPSVIKQCLNLPNNLINKISNNVWITRLIISKISIFKRNSFRLRKHSEWPNVTFLPQTIHHAFHSIQLIIRKHQSPRSTTRSKNKARYFWTRKNNKATLPSRSTDGENNGGSYNHGQSTLVSPRARNWNARVECPIGSPASSCRGRSKRKVSSVSRCKKPGYRASPIPFYLPLSLFFSFCLVPFLHDFVILALDSSRSPRKCLLGWKIARILDDGRIDLVRDANRPKGCWWIGWRS